MANQAHIANNISGIVSKVIKKTQQKLMPAQGLASTTL